MPAITPSNTTLEYFDGFDDYNTAQMSRYWNSVVSNVGIGSGNGRNGTNALTQNGNLSTVAITLTPQATRTVGFAFKFNAFSSGDTIFALLDGTTVQLDIRIVTGGLLRVTRNGTTLATSTLAMNQGIWYYIEFSSVINATTGLYILKVAGVVWASGSSVNTQATANASANIVQLFSSANNQSSGYLIDDFYSRSDGTFMGDQRVESRLPNANGATNVWIPSTAPNFSCVNENPANDDTNYVASANANDVDLYTYPALSTTTGTVAAVMVCPIERVDTAGTATSCAVYRSSGGTVYNGSTQSIGATTYGAYPDIQGQDPSTSAAWTIAGVNNFQYGLKRLS